MPSLPKPKFIPTRWYELRRLWRDQKLDASLESEEGRRVYWDVTLPQACEQDSKIALLEQSLGLEGDVIECGVYRGGSLMKIARTLVDQAPEKTLYGCDSFGGFPEDQVDEVDLGPRRRMGSVKTKFRFCNDTPERLTRRFELFGVRGELVPGFFSDTLGRFRDQTFCFVHLDVDLYSSYLDCLDALYECVTPGGVIVFDECDTRQWPGATRALREFFANRSETVQLCLDRENVAYYVQKTGEAARAAA